MLHTVQVRRWHMSGRVLDEEQRQHVLTLSLPIKGASDTDCILTLASLVENWGAVVSEEGAWHSSKSSLMNCPHMLVLHLQRFAVLHGRTVKLRHSVQFDERLQVSLASRELISYRLVSVLVHHGQEAQVGHYSAYVLVGDAGYVHCNDLSPRSDSHTIDQLVHATSREAYMFLLHRC